MPKYRVSQHFEGSIQRTIEADSVEEAEDKMLHIEDTTFDELIDANWDYPEVVEEVKEE